MWAVFLLSLSLPLQILYISTSQTSWQTQTRLFYIFQLWVIVKGLLEQISLYLLSHCHIRIIVLTCPDHKCYVTSLQEIISWNHACCKITQITMLQVKYYFKWNLCSLSACSCSCVDSRVPPLNLYWDISIVWFQKISIPPLPHRGLFPVWAPTSPRFSVPEGFTLLPSHPLEFPWFLHLVAPTPGKFQIHK